MNRFALGLGAGLLIHGLLAWAEDITVTSYYPSPRGVYEELRATRYRGVDDQAPYEIDLDKGTALIKEVHLMDKKTQQEFGLSVDSGRLLFTDYKQKKAYIVFELPPDEKPGPAAPKTAGSQRRN